MIRKGKVKKPVSLRIGLEVYVTAFGLRMGCRLSHIGEEKNTLFVGALPVPVLGDKKLDIIRSKLS